MKLNWMRTEWGKAILTSRLAALPRKMLRFRQSIAYPWIRKDGVRGVNTAPGGVMICDGDSETVGMVRLVAEGKGVDVDEVVADVAVVAMDKLHMTNKDFKKLEVFITDVKKYLVATNIDICF